MNIFTVSFFGHRLIDRPFLIEQRLENLIRRLINTKEYVDFLVGRSGDFDQYASSAVLRTRKAVGDHNSSLTLVLPYPTAEYLNNFRDPVARTFMDVDFEDYLRVEVLQRMPQRQEAEAEIDAFYHSLSDEQKGVYDASSSYLVSLELDLTKLAHYAGFMFANDMLKYTEPGYVPNYVLTLRYQSFMSDWFGTEFKVWREEMKETEGLSA